MAGEEKGKGPSYTSQMRKINSSQVFCIHNKYPVDFIYSQIMGLAEQKIGVLN